MKGMYPVDIEMMTTFKVSFEKPPDPVVIVPVVPVLPPDPEVLTPT